MNNGQRTAVLLIINKTQIYTYEKRFIFVNHCRSNVGILQ